MITLLHGGHIDASRKELNKLKESAVGREVRVVDGKSVAPSELVQSLQSSSLFGGDTYIIVERLFGKLGKQPKKIEELCLVLKAASETADIVLWEDKEVGATVIKHLGTGANVRLFAIPVLIFQFLDGISPGKSRQLLEVYGQTTATEAPELVFSMLVKRVRQLIQVKDGVTPEAVAPWQVGRLTTQAKSFTMEKLLGYYGQFLSWEASIKTGTSPFSLSAYIEQFIVNL